ncbi:MAG TPA: hypothetical protein VH251_07865 [Verrucomicrobiae bacterium]|nr:hypothetical protein [Verrucomicrobiae bacterium]
MPQNADAISPRQGKVASYAHTSVIVAKNLYATFAWLGGGQCARE